MFNPDELAAFIRRMAYERGLRGDTFATADEYRHPEYDRAYTAGAAARAVADQRYIEQHNI
jgi:hypothetical protein